MSWYVLVHTSGHRRRAGSATAAHCNKLATVLASRIFLKRNENPLAQVYVQVSSGRLERERTVCAEFCPCGKLGSGDDILSALGLYICNLKRVSSDLSSRLLITFTLPVVCCMQDRIGARSISSRQMSRPCLWLSRSSRVKLALFSVLARCGSDESVAASLSCVSGDL